jgi:hypothetical protein
MTATSRPGTSVQGKETTSTPSPDRKVFKTAPTFVLSKAASFLLQPEWNGRRLATMRSLGWLVSLLALGCAGAAEFGYGATS